MKKPHIDQTEMDYDAEEAAPENETKAARFSRVVNPRLKVAVKRLRMVRQMFEGGNANNYEFTDEQRRKLMAVLSDEIAQIDLLMGKRLDKDGTAFDIAI